MAAPIIVEEQGRTENLTRDGVTVVRTLRVYPYNQRHVVAFGLLGGVSLIGNALFRYAPARDPWCPYCFADSVDIEGMQPFTGALANGRAVLAASSTYDSAIMKVTYKTLTYDPQADGSGDSDPSQKDNDEQKEIDICEEQIDFGSQQLTLPNKFFSFQTKLPSGTVVAGTPLLNQSVNATRTFPQMEYVLVRRYVVRLPLLAISCMLGRINSQPFRVGLQTFAAETLRFEGGSAKRKVTNQGIQFAEVQYRFAVQPTIYYTGYITRTPSPGGGTGTSDAATQDADSPRFVGWNRIYSAENDMYMRPSNTSNPNSGMYQYDTDPLPQQVRQPYTSATGFKTLFSTRAI